MKEEVLSVHPVPKLFIKTKLNSSKNHLEVLKKITEFAQKQKFELDNTIYSFTKEAIMSDLYFKYDQDIMEHLFFRSFKWASKKEEKSKVELKSFQDVRDNKKNQLYTILMRELVKSIYRNDLKNKEIELSKYIILFYELG